MSISSKDVETWRDFLSRTDDLISDMKTARDDKVLPKDEVGVAIAELDRFREYLTWKSNWADPPSWAGTD